MIAVDGKPHMKLCKDCKHSNHTLYTCRNPALYEISVVDGCPKDIETCHFQRSEKGKCKPKGIYFEGKKTWWDWLNERW